MKITTEFKHKVIAELLEVRKRFSGSDKAFSEQYGLNNAVFSQLKNGKPIDGLVRDVQWLQMGRRLDVAAFERKWKLVRTEVVVRIEEEVTFCKDNAKAMMLVDDAELGKTYTAKYLARTLENCFYLDCSQAKTKREFIRAFAQAIGVESAGKLSEVVANIKYYLQMLPNPVVILDEVGDLEYNAFLLLKEFWNATEGQCGWYMMGADGLSAKIKRGIANKKVGYREIFSRFSSRFRKITPNEKTERIDFYRQLITEVLQANCSDPKRIPELVKRCLVPDEYGNIGGLRRAESLLILSQKQVA